MVSRSPPHLFTLNPLFLEGGERFAGGRNGWAVAAMDD